jgi:hypothetical protein
MMEIQLVDAFRVHVRQQLRIKYSAKNKLDNNLVHHRNKEAIGLIFNLCVIGFLVCILAKRNGESI